MCGVTVGQSENGPPPVEFPFAAQITVTPDTVDAGQAFATVLRDNLIGRQLTVGGSDVTITDSIIGTDGEIYRVDGQQVIEVRAQYDEDGGLTGILNAI